MAKDKDGGEALGKQAEDAARAALSRLTAMLSDPETPGGEALKAAAIVLERVWKTQATQEAAGDYEIKMT